MTILNTKHPTAYFVTEELKSLGLVLENAWLDPWTYNPYITLDSKQVL